MRNLFAVLPLLLINAFQSTLPTTSAPAQAPAITLRNARSTEQPGRGAVFLVWPSGFYLQTPMLSVAANPLVAGVEPVAQKFNARAWREGNKTRVIVYAIVLDRRSPDGELEKPLATFWINLGQQVEVAETEKWGAEHVIVTGIPLTDLR